MSSAGTITRKDIITDDALAWGDDYAKNLDAAIAKNKEFVSIILQMRASSEELRKAEGFKEMQAALKRSNEIGEKGLKIWKEQDQLEKQLISTKKKNELATESTNQALIKERTLLQEVNKQIKQEQRDRLGLVGAHEKLTRARNEAQKRLGDLLSAEKRNTAEIARANIEFQKLEARLSAVNAAINNYKNNIGNYQSAFKGLRGTLVDLMSAFGLVGGLQLFSTILKDVFSVIREFDRQLIAVGKTTGISGAELDALGVAVIDLGGKLDGISIQGLLESAEVAGQLGVTGTANILKFSEAVEKLRLTSNIISEEQVGSFAKFIEVSSDSFENADRLASVITALGNAYASTEGEILANATEIQKGIAVYNTSAQGVLGLAAATSTLGSEAEASRSAVQTTFGVLNDAIATGKNLEQVLKLTGLTEKQLSEQFNKDATGVFLKFVKGLKDSKDQGKNLSLTLDELGISEKRAFTVVGSLAANYGVLENAMKSAGAEYKENAALNEEVAAAAQSIDSVLNDLRDEWSKYVLQQNNANEGSQRIVKTLRFLKDNLADVITNTLKFGAIILTFIGVQKAWNTSMIIWNGLKAASTTLQLRFAMATGVGTVAIKAQAAAAREAAAATTLLNTATKSTPWGLILGIVLSLVAAYDAFAASAGSVADAQKRLAEAAEKDAAALAESEKSFDNFYRKKLKAISDEYAIKRAAQGDSERLDQEEIDAQKTVAENAIAGNNKIIASNASLVEDEKRKSAERVRILEETRQRLLAVDDESQGAAREAAKKYQRDIESEKASSAVIIQRMTSDSESKKKLNKKLNDDIAEIDQQAAVLKANNQRELSDKEKRDQEKRAREREALARKEWEAQKKLMEDRSKLDQFQLQVKIDANQDFIENENNFIDERLDAIDENEKLIAEQVRKQSEKELRQFATYNAEKGKFIRDFSDKEVAEIIRTGKTKKALTDEQKLIYARFQNSMTQTAIDAERKREQVIDQSAENQAKAWEERIKKVIEGTGDESQIIMEKEIMNLQKALQEKRITVEKYEESVARIRQQYAQANLENQIQTLETELATLADTDEKKAVLKKVLHNLEVQLSNVSTQTQIDNEAKILEVKRAAISEASNALAESFGLDAQVIERFLEGVVNGFKSTGEAIQATMALVSEITSAIFSARIQNIDIEIQREQEKYDRLIELAGNDQRQKDLLTKESEKKRDELEKKKRKEQEKAAMYDKALKIVQTGIATALAIMQAYTLGPIAGSAAAIWIAILGGIQTAAIAAAPIPKAYKLGRKGGPEELAIVGDGGRPEVITDRHGSNPRLTPNKPTYAHLKEGDIVHKSKEDYFRFMSKTSLRGIAERQQRHEAAYQILNATADSPELLKEMQLTRKAIERIKLPRPQHQSPQNINHELWAMTQTKWR
ncbi:hypothetical protein [Flavobacterium selenitireducens]|uniref:hypothetical protein n=1 Tax=Flavobacterium selenitireducens TaxID=2722704 RepID=UPI00168A4A22|nr:hypothetical protein [Flavobacterium selenitireducens]MBD3582753.1 hypothetical protein [Flavobacterium selenitireducens]